MNGPIGVGLQKAESCWLILTKVAVSAKTMRPSAAAVRRIGEVLSGGDFFSARDGETASRSPMADPIRAHAWPWLMQAGKLAEPHGTKLALTRAGLAAFGAPQEQTLRRLWQRWITVRTSIWMRTDSTC